MHPAKHLDHLDHLDPPGPGWTHLDSRGPTPLPKRAVSLSSVEDYVRGPLRTSFDGAQDDTPGSRCTFYLSPLTFNLPNQLLCKKTCIFKEHSLLL